MNDTDSPAFESRTYRKWNVDRAEFIDLRPGDPENVRVRSYVEDEYFAGGATLLSPQLETDTAPWSAQWWAEYVQMLEDLGYKEV
jgi:hypothetical protein